MPPAIVIHVKDGACVARARRIARRGQDAVDPLRHHLAVVNGPARPPPSIRRGRAACALRIHAIQVRRQGTFGPGRLQVRVDPRWIHIRKSGMHPHGRRASTTTTTAETARCRESLSVGMRAKLVARNEPLGRQDDAGGGFRHDKDSYPGEP